MGKSGARLAWEFFQPDAPIPDLVRFVEDRDLWNWQYPDSAAYLAALDTQAQTQFVARGLVMDDKFTKLAADIAEDAQPVVFNGVTGLMVNAPGVFHSLVGELLSKTCGSFALM